MSSITVSADTTISNLSSKDKRLIAIANTPLAKDGDKLRLWLSFAPPLDYLWTLRNDIIVECNTYDEAWNIACTYESYHYIDKPSPTYTSAPDKPDSNKRMLNMHMIVATDDFQIALLSGIEKPNMSNWVDIGYKNWSYDNIPPLIISANDYLNNLEIEIIQKKKWSD